MDRDRSQPRSKRAGALIVLELGELINQRGQHLLDEIVGIRPLRDVGGNPPADQGHINVREFPPGGGIASVPGAVQQAL
jgi:hypothetical protein